jgi:DNA-binding transcriptional ArsR family regulator
MARRKSSEMLMKPPSEKSAGRRPSRPTFRPLDAHEIELTDFFVRMAAIIGVPRSVAEIYALLYASPEALDFDHIQGRLGISKGSVSQGLKFLRDHEMILALKAPGSRRERWQPTPSLAASLVALLRSQVLPFFATYPRRRPSAWRSNRSDRTPHPAQPLE